MKPDGLLDGHPASSKVDLFEGMLADIFDRLHHNHELASDTAVIITWDEGGGYYDSGYIQPLDFFGDGPRIPLIVVSPFSRGGHVNHTYSDHVSILKFIERNWGLTPLTGRSRDNFPNPTTDSTNPYVPTNSPAIGDLFDMFDFGDAHRDDHGTDGGRAAGDTHGASRLHGRRRHAGGRGPSAKKTGGIPTGVAFGAYITVDRSTVRCHSACGSTDGDALWGRTGLGVGEARGY